MSNIGAVIGWKFNHQAGMSTSDGVITGFPNGIPTQAEQDTWTAEYNDYISANAYKELRRAEYDSIGNQLDMIYKDNLNGTTTHKASVEAVKAKYPKPE